MTRLTIKVNTKHKGNTRGRFFCVDRTMKKITRTDVLERNFRDISRKEMKRYRLCVYTFLIPYDQKHDCKKEGK